MTHFPRLLRPLALLTLLQGSLSACATVTPAPALAPVPEVASPIVVPNYVHQTRELMSTYIEVAVPEGPRSAEATEAVFQAFAEVEQFANEWKDPSPLAAVNKAAGGDAVPVPAPLLELLERGKQLGTLTGGAFDITWAALWGLWDFNAAHPKVPDPAEVQKRLPLIQYQALELNATATTARLPTVGMKIGLGGIAKGFALDRSAAALRARGVSSYLLSAGGQITAGGMKGDKPWRVGIRDPRGAMDDTFAIVTITDASLSTSGDYERYFERDGVRYHHILDPRTGMPSTGLRSATVIGPDATQVDALSTAMMVMGLERSRALLSQLPGIEAVLVDAQGGLFVTPGLKDKLTLVHAPLNP